MPKLPVTADTKGRLRTSKEQRRVILTGFEESGLSASQFAQRTGLKYSTFASWVRKRHAECRLTSFSGAMRTCRERPEPGIMMRAAVEVECSSKRTG
jgi:hypothetical protein